MGKEKVDAVLAELETAPIESPGSAGARSDAQRRGELISDKLRATLGLLRKVTREHAAVTAADIAPLLALGVTRSQIEDALHVCFCFNVITRLADTFQFEIGSQASFDTGAKSLLGRGYKL